MSTESRRRGRAGGGISKGTTMHVVPTAVRSGILLAALAAWLTAPAARCEPPDVKPAGPTSREIVVGPPAGDGHGDAAAQRELQGAIDRLADAGGGTVRIAPGRYVLRAALMLRDHVRV